jgi:hypothetical protein
LITKLIATNSTIIKDIELPAKKLCDISCGLNISTKIYPQYIKWTRLNPETMNSIKIIVNRISLSKGNLLI